jgi:hypothetical protein
VESLPSTQKGNLSAAFLTLSGKRDLFKTFWEKPYKDNAKGKDAISSHIKLHY